MARCNIPHARGAVLLARLLPHRSSVAQDDNSFARRPFHPSSHLAQHWLRHAALVEWLRGNSSSLGRRSMVARLCRDRGDRRACNIRALAQEAGDVGCTRVDTTCTRVDTTSRGNRKHRPNHRGRVQAITELIERRSGARPDPPWRGAWLQRTNLWRR